MNEENDKPGIIYVLENKWMPGLVKIGKSSRKELRHRLRELYKTGVPAPFTVLKAVRVRDADALEQALHKAFETDRVNPKREFFQMSGQRAIAILDYAKEEDITEQAGLIISEGLDERELEAREKGEEAQAARKRPALDYFELGIKENDHLYWKDDPTKVATVCGNKKVVFEGHIMSLSKATQTILGKPYSIQPSPYWMYDGKTLIDIYNEKYPVVIDETEEETPEEEATE